MKNINISVKFVPLGLLFLNLISFAPLIPRLGLYWDDWPSLWFLHYYGPGVFPDVFTIDRPAQGWLFILTTGLVGESMVAWQLFGILTRWISCLSLWWVLRLIWPKRIIEATWITFLFAVYPGFNQQYIPITYSHMSIMLSIFLISIATMILAYQKHKWFWPLILFSLSTSAVTMFTLEYFVGLELLRPVILLMISNKDSGKTGKRIVIALKRWLPYLFILIAFFIWRITNKTPRGQVTLLDDLHKNPFTTVADLLKTVISDMYKSSILAWAQTINFQTLLTYRTTIIILVGFLILTAAILTIFFMMRLDSGQKSDQEPDQNIPLRWELQSIFLGIYSLLIGGWPIWATNLKIDLKFPWDRFTLMMMLGASLLLVGLVFLITRNRLQSSIILGIIVGLSVGMHFQTGLTYMRDWNYQKAFFWQLVWRAPEIKPGTVLITSKLPFLYVTDNSLTAPINWTYAPENYTRQMPYGLINIDARLGRNLTSLEEDTPIHQPYRATSFEGSTSQALIMYYSPEHCLKMIDPELDRFWPYKPGFIPEAMHLSDTDLIMIDSEKTAFPPAQVFGAEPEPDWCYYFEKAELARQSEEWDKVAQFGDKALKLEKVYNKKNASELITFIQGYAHVGRWGEAEKLSVEANRHSNIIKDSLCEVWSELAVNTPVSENQRSAIEKINNKLHCNIP